MSYKLTDNFSIKNAHAWINREEVISDIQDQLFNRYNFEHTNINMDWTSIVLHGDKAPLGKYGYSRDHRPDKKQITIGISELADPIHIPIGVTVEKGNMNDQTHFKKTYLQVNNRLEEGSLVVFDKGANSINEPCYGQSKQDAVCNCKETQ